jgi:hypothetical protein
MAQQIFRLRGHQGRCRDPTTWHGDGPGHALGRGRNLVRLVFQLHGLADPGLPSRTRLHLHLIGIDTILLLPHTSTLRYHVLLLDRGRLSRR